MPNKRSLQVFLQVYNSGSVRIAADRLFVTPQNVSKTILDIEAALGETLFIREHHKLTPTPRAVQLKNHAERILREYDLIYKSEPTEETTQLRVYCTYGVPEYLGAEFIQDFSTQYPNILLYLIEMPDRQAQEMLRQGKEGVAILSDPVDHNLFSSHFLFTADYSYVVGENDLLSRKEMISLKDLNNVPIVGKGDEFQLYINQLSDFSRQSIQPRIVLETTSYHLAMQMAKAHKAIAFVPKYLAQRYAPQNTCVVPANSEEHQKIFTFVQSKGFRPSVASQAFFRFLKSWRPEE